MGKLGYAGIIEAYAAHYVNSSSEEQKQRMMDCLTMAIMAEGKDTDQFELNRRTAREISKARARKAK
jgi:hypothetical protein